MPSCETQWHRRTSDVCVALQVFLDTIVLAHVGCVRNINVDIVSVHHVVCI